MSHQCPSCSDSFETRRGVSIHHAKSHGESISGVAVECEQCCDEYNVKPNRADNSRFCSRECKSTWYEENKTGENNPNWRGGVDERDCEWCEKTFKPNKTNSGQRFCSRKCMGMWESETMSGKNHWNWSGGYSLYYGSWQQEKEECRERDGGCLICGMSISEHKDKYGQNPDVHHIKPVDNFENPEDAHYLSNLVTLCRQCHTDVENGKKDLSIYVDKDNT